MNTAAAVLKDTMTNTGLSQAKFGASVGVTQGLVGQWLRSERPISVTKAVEIEKVYLVDASLLNDDVKLARESMPKSRKAA